MKWIMGRVVRVVGVIQLTRGDVLGVFRGVWVITLTHKLPLPTPNPPTHTNTQHAFMRLCVCVCTCALIRVIRVLGLLRLLGLLGLLVWSGLAAWYTHMIKLITFLLSSVPNTYTHTCVCSYALFLQYTHSMFSCQDGDTPLHKALKRDRVEVAKCLIEANANLEATDRVRGSSGSGGRSGGGEKGEGQGEDGVVVRVSCEGYCISWMGL